MFYMRLHIERYQGITTHSKFSKVILLAIHIKNTGHSLGIHTCRKLRKNSLKSFLECQILFSLKNSPCTLREPIIKYGQNNHIYFKNPYWPSRHGDEVRESMSLNNTPHYIFWNTLLSLEQLEKLTDRLRG